MGENSPAWWPSVRPTPMEAQVGGEEGEGVEREGEASFRPERMETSCECRTSCRQIRAEGMWVVWKWREERRSGRRVGQGASPGKGVLVA